MSTINVGSAGPDVQSVPISPTSQAFTVDALRADLNPLLRKAEVASLFFTAEGLPTAVHLLEEAVNDPVAAEALVAIVNYVHARRKIFAEPPTPGGKLGRLTRIWNDMKAAVYRLTAPALMLVALLVVGCAPEPCPCNDQACICNEAEDVGSPRRLQVGMTVQYVGDQTGRTYAAVVTDFNGWTNEANLAVFVRNDSRGMPTYDLQRTTGVKHCNEGRRRSWHFIGERMERPTAPGSEGDSPPGQGPGRGQSPPKTDKVSYSRKAAVDWRAVEIINEINKERTLNGLKRLIQTEDQDSLALNDLGRIIDVEKTPEYTRDHRITCQHLDLRMKRTPADVVDYWKTWGEDGYLQPGLKRIGCATRIVVDPGGPIIFYVVRFADASLHSPSYQTARPRPSSSQPDGPPVLIQALRNRGRGSSPPVESGATGLPFRSIV